MSDSKHVTYEDAGVDTAEGGRAVDAIKQMVKDTNRPEVIGGIGGFGGLFSAAALKDMEDPILISGTDGVGTKLVLAQIMDRHETVGQDLVAMCVNDILASGAEPLFFLDYVAIGHIEAGLKHCNFQCKTGAFASHATARNARSHNGDIHFAHGALLATVTG